MKTQIANLYILAVLNDEAPNPFADKVMALIGIDSKETRSNQQNKSRWKYLSMCASILNDQGQTYTPQGTKINVKYTKDLLYEVYWQSMRTTLYPGKKKQLNTKEFSELVDMVRVLFAEVFEIIIPFPNFKDMIKPKE